jgi:hypothetical protein
VAPRALCGWKKDKEKKMGTPEFEEKKRKKKVNREVRDKR